VRQKRGSARWWRATGIMEHGGAEQYYKRMLEEQWHMSTWRSQLNSKESGDIICGIAEPRKGSARGAEQSLYVNITRQKQYYKEIEVAVINRHNLGTEE
jgi:hypothetical protein